LIDTAEFTGRLEKTCGVYVRIGQGEVTSMNTPPIVKEVIEQVKTLRQELQWQVLEFTRALAQATPRGIPGKQLPRFAGVIPPDDVRFMREAIE
jgi:hypothetical protein